MRRWGAVGIVLVPALAAAWSPPARAAGVSTVVVTGTWTLNGPVQAPCVEVDASHACPPSIVLTPPPFIGKMGPPFSTDGDLRTANFTQATCAPAPCTVVLSTSYRGYCGLATGRGSGGILDAAGEAHTLQFTFTLVGTEMAIRGNATRHATGEVGDLFATFAVVPPPVECATGTATAFPAAGDLTVTYPKVTP